MIVFFSVVFVVLITSFGIKLHFGMVVKLKAFFYSSKLAAYVSSNDCVSKARPQTVTNPDVVESEMTVLLQHMTSWVLTVRSLMMADSQTTNCAEDVPQNASNTPLSY